MLSCCVWGVTISGIVYDYRFRSVLMSFSLFVGLLSSYLICCEMTLLFLFLLFFFFGVFLFFVKWLSSLFLFFDDFLFLFFSFLLVSQHIKHHLMI